MTRLILKRIVHAVPLLFLITLVAFALGNAAPSDPARMALAAGGTGVQIDERDVELKRIELGLDRPLPERYLTWLGDLVQGDLGESFTSGRSVTALFVERFPASLMLAVLAMVVAIAVGVPLGMASAVRPNGLIDYSSRLLALACVSLPAFWIALMAIALFAAKLHLVPAIGQLTFAGAILPILVLSLRPLGRLIRLMQTTTAEVLRSEHVKVTRGKGLGEFAIMRRHVLPNAILPIVAVIGLDLAVLIANSAVVEWVFAWPGVGRLGVEAALAGDLPVLMAFTVVVSVVVLLTTLLVDITYALMDPRIREEVRA
ncbi:ABC transporter permease [Jiangella asiatica]|uniref:ABC transporter permease n=1 Tax=Jiangella asiatica TaxID=2530372 RepID=A0A4R5DEG3_9ACTN|nr:ABC transporter permease [Jiangella asiatica]TDE12169.1 ABC transporter permease [Jiangella asiatica]